MGMCAWAIEELHGFGLRHCVILDSSFEGAKARLEALPDMKIVSITHPDSVSRMRTFGRRYPWDWEADIGEILPRHAKYEAIIAKSRAEGSTWLSARAEGEAAVIGPDFDVLAVASDGCQASAGNSCRCVGACVLFKPAVLVTYPIDASVSEPLVAAGIVIVQVPFRGTKRKAEAMTPAMKEDAMIVTAV